MTTWLPLESLLNCACGYDLREYGASGRQDLTYGYISGSSSVGRASAFQAECREFEPRLPLHANTGLRMAFEQKLSEIENNAHVAQSVERFLGKEEVHRFDSDRGLHW